ncbi:MAG: ribonuclease P protein component [Acidimicrobiales bacterium]
MIGRLSGRHEFARLRADGARVGRGPVQIISRYDEARTPPTTRIAFAIPRSVGSAVVRNRIRRRIRAMIHDLDRDPATRPMPGDHLIRVSAPIDAWPATQLRQTMMTLLPASPSSPAARS